MATQRPHLDDPGAATAEERAVVERLEAALLERCPDLRDTILGLSEHIRFGLAAVCR